MFLNKHINKKLSCQEYCNGIIIIKGKHMDNITTNPVHLRMINSHEVNLMPCKLITVSRYLICLLIFLVSISSYAQVTVEMRNEDGVYTVPGKVNGLPLKFIFDTGASNVCLSATEAIFMIKNGYLNQDDIKGQSYSLVANGDIVENTEITLREVEIGGIKIKNVKALVSHSINAPLLFGQSAIQKLGPIQLDKNKLIIQNGKDFRSDEKAYELCMQAYDANDAQNYQKSIHLCREALALAADKELISIIYANLARAYAGIEDWENVINSCNNGLSADPENADIGYNLGLYYYELGKIDLAKKTFERFIEIHERAPIDNFTKKCLGGVYSYLGRIYESKDFSAYAEDAFKKCIKYMQNSPVGYSDLGSFYFNQEKYAEAIEPLNKAISFIPSHRDAIRLYYRVGYCFLHDLQKQQGIDNLKKCGLSTKIEHKIG